MGAALRGVRRWEDRLVFECAVGGDCSASISTIGRVRTVIDTPTGDLVELETLSYDWQTILVSFRRGETPARWQVWRHGAAAPVMEFLDTATVSMSRNGRWVATVLWRPKGSFARVELTAGTARAARSGNDCTAPLCIRRWDGKPAVRLNVFLRLGWEDDDGVADVLWSGKCSAISVLLGRWGLTVPAQHLLQYERVARKTVELPVHDAPSSGGLRVRFSAGQPRSPGARRDRVPAQRTRRRCWIQRAARQRRCPRREF